MERNNLLDCALPNEATLGNLPVIDVLPPCIFFLDSLGSYHNEHRITHVMRDYLQHELKCKKNTSKNFNKTNLPTFNLKNFVSIKLSNIIQYVYKLNNKMVLKIASSLTSIYSIFFSSSPSSSFPLVLCFVPVPTFPFFRFLCRLIHTTVVYMSLNILKCYFLYFFNRLITPFEVTA